MDNYSAWTDYHESEQRMREEVLDQAVRECTNRLDRWEIMRHIEDWPNVPFLPGSKIDFIRARFKELSHG